MTNDKERTALQRAERLRQQQEELRRRQQRRNQEIEDRNAELYETWHDIAPD